MAPIQSGRDLSGSMTDSPNSVTHTYARATNLVQARLGRPYLYEGERTGRGGGPVGITEMRACSAGRRRSEAGAENAARRGLGEMASSKPAKSHDMVRIVLLLKGGVLCPVLASR